MRKSLSNILIASTATLVVLLIAWAVWQGQEAAERATVSVDDQALSVRLADNAWERRRGLSGLAAEDVKAQGMLFVFPAADIRYFWMQGMKLDLDVVWIRDGQVVAVDEHVQAPTPGAQPAHMNSAPIPVDMVLEIPAGYVQRFGFLPGMPIKIELPE